jgi:hypothetical protein
MCHPEAADSFARRCGGPVELVRVTRSEDGGRAPGHMALVTTDRARPQLLAALAWVEAHAQPAQDLGAFNERRRRRE